jgi:hypothetical protein
MDSQVYRVILVNRTVLGAQEIYTTENISWAKITLLGIGIARTGSEAIRRAPKGLAAGALCF